LQTVAVLGFFPTHSAADAAFDAWYTYETAVRRGGIAAIPLNQHDYPLSERDTDGVPLCPRGLRMHPTYQFAHTHGYRAQRYCCPLLFPEATGQICDHAQFAKQKGCVKDINIEPGGLMRINSQAKALGIERPHVRNGRSVRNLNTLIYLMINVRALERAKSINRRLLFLN